MAISFDVRERSIDEGQATSKCLERRHSARGIGGTTVEAFAAFHIVIIPSDTSSLHRAPMRCNANTTKLDRMAHCIDVTR